jgi:hypothetical protein
MNVLRMMDDLLRDRNTLYEMATHRERLGGMCARLLLIFLLTTCIYGAAMGCFRWAHSGYYFSNFELSTPGQAPVSGKVAGMTVDDRTVYTQVELPATEPETTVRFNLSDPSEPYKVAETGKEKGYQKMVLAPGASLAEGDAWKLPVMVAVKTPLLFILTLLVCTPALYVINLALGMRLHFMPVMTLMVFALAGTGVMLVVFAPIALLFSMVTASYHFMKVLHLLIFVIAGLFGVKILGEGLARMRQEQAEEAGSPPRGKGRLVLLAWLLLYALVGAQLAWTLKPFLGTPYLPDTPPFRVERGNIFVSTWESFQQIRDD